MRFSVSQLLALFDLLVNSDIMGRTDDVANTKELEVLQGVWQVVKPDACSPIRLSIRKDKAAILKDTKTTKYIKKQVTWSIKLNLDATKKAIEIEFPGKRSEVVLALYQLKDDTLKLCVLSDQEKAAKERPKEFGEKEGQVVLEFVRDTQSSLVL